MDSLEPSKAIRTTTGAVRGLVYSGDGETRKLIDTLSTNESFILGGFTFRVEGELPAFRKARGNSSYARVARKCAWSVPEKH